MAKFYFLRHAESLANAKGIYQGQTYDTGLSPHGKIQAKGLKNYFACKSLDLIIASPLKRTVATAHEIKKATGADILIEKQIIETNHGQWEGKNKDYIKSFWKDVYEKWMENPADTAFPNGETFLETQKRVLGWWKKAKTNKGEIAVVTHDNIIRIILAHTLGLDLNNIWKFNLLPTAINIIETNREGDKVITLNDTRHLNSDSVNIFAHAL